MCYRLFLVSALVVCCTGWFSVRGAPEKVLALAGGYVVLPCSFNITASSYFPTVEWSKKDLRSNIIFLYRDGCETYEMKNPAFEFRTSLIAKDLKNGDVSLRISDVQLSDAGQYQCMRLWKNSHKDITVVELAVDAVSEPRLSVVSAEGGRVTLQCEVKCSVPEPEIMFLDDQGSGIPAEGPKRDQDARGWCIVKQRMALQTATSRITCRVHWPDSNRTTSREILIPADYMRSCSLITEVTVGTVVVLALACGLVGFLFKMCDKCAAGQKQSMSREELRDSTERHTFESQLLMKREDVADNKANSKVEELEKQVDELKSKLREKNKNSFRSQPGPVQHNQPTLPSKLSPDVFKSTTSTNDHIPNSTISADNHPTSATVPRNEGPNPGIQRIRRRNSSPPMLCANTATSLSSSASTSKRNRCSVSGFINTSYADPDPVHAKLQRKRSSGCMSPHFDNQYSVLVDVPDESEPDQSSEDSH